MSTSNYRHLHAQNGLFWAAQQGVFDIAAHLWRLILFVCSPVYDFHLCDRLACVSGIPFMQVEALDRDERSSVNAELRFSLLEQTPRIPSSQMFSIDSITGEVSLTEEGLYRPAQQA